MIVHQFKVYPLIVSDKLFKEVLNNYLNIVIVSKWKEIKHYINDKFSLTEEGEYGGCLVQYFTNTDKFGEIVLALDSLSYFVITHEATHAALALIRKFELFTELSSTEANNIEEFVANLIGFISEQIIANLVSLGLRPWCDYTYKDNMILKEGLQQVIDELEQEGGLSSAPY